MINGVTLYRQYYSSDICFLVCLTVLETYSSSDSYLLLTYSNTTLPDYDHEG